MFVYVITNNVTGKIYIGQHKGNNLKKYLHMKLSQAVYELKRRGKGGGSYLFASMRKHPKEVWSIAPLFEGIETKAELDRIETLLIALFDTRNPDVGYNICRGGEGFTGNHTEEHRQKMRDNAPRYWLGKKRSHETSVKRIATFKANGGDYSALNSHEARAKQVASRKTNDNYKGIPGHKHTPETLEKMRASATKRETAELKQRRGNEVRKAAAKRNAEKLLEVSRLLNQGNPTISIAAQVGVPLSTLRVWVRKMTTQSVAEQV